MQNGTKMITITDLVNLRDGDGFTLKHGVSIRYKTGWQAATAGITTTEAGKAMEAVKAFAGNCGIWFSEGIYYIDKSHWVKTKKEALEIGRKHNQISILRWKDLGLVYC